MRKKLSISKLFLMSMVAVSVNLASSVLADDALKTSIASLQRSAENKVRDAARHPYETLQFFGIRSDMKVVELAPGGGWYTEILAPYLRDKGQLHIVFQGAKLKKMMEANPIIFDKVQVSSFDAKENLSIAQPASVDMVLTFRNVHNWMDPDDARLKKILKASFEVLKSGGTLGVVEHRLPANKAQDATASTGYVQQAYIIKMAEAAGFKLAAQSEINANAKDTADHENGVWALPPTYANKDKDKAKYAAIGESDRMTLKFTKP